MNLIRYENNRKYILTKHLRQRYCERVLNRSYDGRLTKEEDTALMRIVYSAPEERTWVNNLNIVHHLKTKYGANKILILKHNSYWFICHESEVKNHYVVITVYDSTKYEWSKICRDKETKISQIINTKSTNYNR